MMNDREMGLQLLFQKTAYLRLLGKLSHFQILTLHIRSQPIFWLRFCKIAILVFFQKVTDLGINQRWKCHNFKPKDSSVLYCPLSSNVVVVLMPSIFWNNNRSGSLLGYLPMLELQFYLSLNISYNCNLSFDLFCLWLLCTFLKVIMS